MQYGYTYQGLFVKSYHSNQHGHALLPGEKLLEHLSEYPLEPVVRLHAGRSERIERKYLGADYMHVVLASLRVE